MLEWLKVSEFWYGTVAGGLVSLGIRYLLLLRKEAGEKDRDNRQQQGKLDAEARQRWNDGVQKLQDYMSKVIAQVSAPDPNHDLNAAMVARLDLLRSTPYEALFLMNDKDHFINVPSDERLLVECTNQVKEINNLLGEVHEGSEIAGIETYLKASDRDKIIELALGINAILGSTPFPRTV